MYVETAAYGHMGRKNEVVSKTFTSRYHEKKTIDVELFTWEKARHGGQNPQGILPGKLRIKS